MNYFTQKIKIAMSAFALTLYCAAPAVAEDIEIYKKENLGALLVKPNILFILDTSGSMGDSISNRELPSDPITLGTVDGKYSTLPTACAGF
ncbi:MAG: hypothetical protein OEY87_06195, partial [Gammaproteobacteria bacterium]|nr:hypothetical protein [Gammaproteobacteria bacterium]